MAHKFKTDNELLDIAVSVIDMPRPLHLAIGEARQVLREAEDGLEYQTLPERPKGDAHV